MASKNYSIVSVISIATLILILIYTFNISSTKAYADEITEATVTTDSSQVDTAIVTTTNRAPVSIAVYSDVVTESSDTYDYTQKQTAVTRPVDVKPVVVTTPAPPEGDFTVTEGAPEAPAATRDPQSTAAPDATPEPDIISYPPTVAPAYQD